MLLTGTIPALKNRFLGHFCITDSQTHKRKVCLTELHVAAKKNKKLKKSSQVSFKLIVSYYVLIKNIKKRIMLLTGTVPALKNRFLGHFCVTDSQTHKLTNSQTHKRKGVLTELHSAAKKRIAKPVLKSLMKH